MKYASSHPEYWVLKNAQRKCTNPKHVDYAYYGGRGIQISSRWLGKDAFDNFVADMGFRPTPEHTLGRMDNEGDYEPGNCRWETRQQQAVNRRRKSTNKSGATGVYWLASRSRWVAVIMRHGKRIRLGSFTDVEAAALAYAEAAKRFDGT